MLLDRYGGSITVEDSDAGGAAFEVELPRVESTASTVSTSAQKETVDLPT